MPECTDKHQIFRVDYNNHLERIIKKRRLEVGSENECDREDSDIFILTGLKRVKIFRCF